MNRASLAAVLLTASLATAADKPGHELVPFQGTWAVQAITKNGVAVPDDQAQRLVLVVKDNTRVVKDGDEVKSKATFTVDSSKTPKQMDITVSDGPLAGKTLRGIYELKDDTLTVCLTLDGDKRPDDLTAKEDSGRLLQVFKKSDAKAAPAVKMPELRTELLARRTADQGGRLKLLALLRKHGGKPEGDAATEYHFVSKYAGGVELHVANGGSNGIVRTGGRGSLWSARTGPRPRSCSPSTPATPSSRRSA